MWNFKASQPLSDEIGTQVEAAIEKLFSRHDLGFLKSEALSRSIQNCEKHKSFFTNKKKLVVIGLGGSSLGTKAIAQALCPDSWQKIIFLDNVDSHSVDLFLSSIDRPQEYGWVLCSKSGGTIEVTSLYDYCFSYIQKKHNFSIVADTACVTEEKPSPIYNFSKANRCLTLSMPEDIGGRFSVFTNIGIFPLSFLGLDLQGLLEGYNQALHDKTRLAEMSAQLWMGMQRQDVGLYSFQYADRLTQWGLWLQQLWSESLAKKQTRAKESAPALATFVPCRGASDQHSVLQQIVEGCEKKMVCFHLVQSSQAGSVPIKNSHFEKSLMVGKPLGALLKVEAEATIESLGQAKVPTMVFEVGDLNEKTVSYLMGLWMLSIGVIGELADVNAFDQPGVESGKIIARRVLSQAD